MLNIPVERPYFLMVKLGIIHVLENLPQTLSC